MGWWSEVKGKDAIELGDEPIDLMHEMVQRISEIYQEEVGRKPTGAEFFTLLTRVIGKLPEDYLDGFEGKEIVEIKAKTRNVPKRQKVQEGDYFAIPLKNGYGYGRYLYFRSLAAVEVYDVQTPVLLSHKQLLAQSPKVLFAKNIFPREAFARRRWIVIGHEPIPEDFVYPRFYMGSRIAYFEITEGPNKTMRASAAEAQHYEPTVAIDVELIEENLQNRTVDDWPSVERIKREDFGS